MDAFVISRYLITSINMEKRKLTDELICRNINSEKITVIDTIEVLCEKIFVKCSIIQKVCIVMVGTINIMVRSLRQFFDVVFEGLKAN